MPLARKEMTMITLPKAILNTDIEKVAISEAVTHNLKSITVVFLVMGLLMQ